MDDLAPLGTPMTQEMAQDRVVAYKLTRARMRELVADYTKTGHSLIACSCCVQAIPRGTAFALHFNPVRMIGQIHCLTCYGAGTPKEQARYTIVQEVPQ